MPFADFWPSNGHVDEVPPHVWRAEEVTAQTVVGVFVDASRTATTAATGVEATPSGRLCGQLGKTAAALLDARRDPGRVLEAARFAGTHGRPPSALEEILGDLERGKPPWDGQRSGSAKAARQTQWESTLHRHLSIARGNPA